MSSELNDCVVIDDCDLIDDEPGPSRMVYKPKACKIEASWFEEEYQTPSRQVKDSSISSQDINKFQNLIWNQPHDRMVPGYGLTPRELASIPSDGRKGWLVSSHFFWLSRCLNKQQSHARCFVFDPQLRQEAVDKLLPFTSRSHIRTLILIMCVGRQDDGVVFFGSNKAQGDHWSLCVIDVREGNIFYCDTLGWPAPPNITSSIITYTRFTGLVHSKQLKLKMAHNANAEQHTCTEECTNYPLQTCSDVCGVVVMICTAIAALDQRLFNLLMKPLDKNLNLYLTDPTEFSTYLRYVLISWLAKGHVDMCKISLKPGFDPLKSEINFLIASSPRSLAKKLPMKRKLDSESKTESTEFSLKNSKTHKTKDVVSTYILDAKQIGVSSSELLKEIVQLTTKEGKKKVIDEFPVMQLCQGLMFNNGVERCQDQIASLKEYIQEFMQKADNPVIMCKLPGRISCGECKDKNDFMIVIQTLFQKKLLEMFGRQCICVDLCRKSEKSGMSLNLFTISIFFDGIYEIPVAWMLTSSHEDHVRSHFFEVIKRNVGEIQVDIFVGDIKGELFKTWAEYFPKPNRNMFYVWEVIQVLHKRLQQHIPDQNILGCCQEYLDVVPLISDEEAFQTYMNAFFVVMKQHSINFVEYFQEKFMKESRAKFWASCYRVIPQAKSVPFLKPFQQVLKGIYFFESGSMNRLDVTFHKLMQLSIFLERSLVGISSETKLVSAVRSIQRKHQQTGGNLDFYQSASGEEWFISPSDDNNAITIVDTGNEDCQCSFQCEACHICLHRYVCSCSDYILNAGACHHIHLLHSSKKVNGLINREAKLNSSTGKSTKQRLDNGSVDDVDELKSSLQKELVRLSDTAFRNSDAKKLKLLLTDLREIEFNKP